VGIGGESLWDAVLEVRLCLDRTFLAFRVHLTLGLAGTDGPRRPAAPHPSRPGDARPSSLLFALRMAVVYRLRRGHAYPRCARACATHASHPAESLRTAYGTA
jgi:hypothetical protein